MMILVDSARPVFEWLARCPHASRAPRMLIAVAFVLVAGCASLQKASQVAEAPVVEPLATHTFTFDPDRDDVVGEVQVTRAHEEDTLPDIARRFNIGYEDVVRANPGVDTWLPHAGTPVVLPTRFILPAAPRAGVVINLAAMRLYYFPPRKEGELQTVVTHPIGIGMVGWSTPEGQTKVVGKTLNPWWYPPVSVRKEHKEDGDPLPAKVPPGPDNPLGAYALKLGWKSYFIHGTNQPYGVGLRASHGCIRMYPEDIALLFKDIPIGTPVTVVNQPIVYGWQGENLYLQVFPAFEDEAGEHPPNANLAATTAVDSDSSRAAKRLKAPIDRGLVTQLVHSPRGISTPVASQRLSLENYVAGARHVENTLPANSTWDGVE